MEVVHKPRCIKPPAVKASVIARRVNGDTERKISRDLKIARQSVHKIIQEADIDQQMTAGLILASELIPDSIRVVKHRLKMNSESAAFGILNPLVLNRASEAKSGKMTADVHLQQSIAVLLHPTVGAPTIEPAQNTQVIDITTDSKS